MTKINVIQQVKTGRSWGDKMAQVRGKAKVGTASVEYEEFDHWAGPIESGQAGEYVRCTAITKSKVEWP